MVWESGYWKLRLKNLVSEIESLSDQPDASDLDISNLEIATFTGFFLIRKLIEAQTKLSHKIENQNLRCKTSSKISDAPLVDILNRFETHELYDLEGFVQTNVPLRKMCNIFVHSVFLCMVYDTKHFPEGEGVVTGVHLTSSYDKEVSIYWVEINEIIRVFQSVIEDELLSLKMYRDPDTNEMKVNKGK